MKFKGPRPPDFWLTWAVAAGVVALAVSASLDPRGPAGWVPPCPFHWLTGFYCPGCGSTRMVYNLIHGRFGEAFTMNPLAMIALPLMLFDVVWAVCGRENGIFSRVGTRYPNSIGVVIVAYMVLRNIPVAPFSYLAPGGLKG